MLRSLWSRIRTTDETGTKEQTNSSDSDSDETDDSGSGFLPSRLDASVLFSHGGPRSERQPTEDSQIPDEEYEVLDEHHRKK